MKGRDPGAQVSSSLPGQGGVGAGTSGLGKCPFGDVRSLSAAPPVPPPLALRVPAGTRPRRPTYTQVRRTCPLAPAGSRLRFLAQPLPRTASLTPQPRADSPGYFGDFQHPGPRLYGPSTFYLGRVAESTKRKHLAFADRLC